MSGFFSGTPASQSGPTVIQPTDIWPALAQIREKLYQPTGRAQITQKPAIRGQQGEVSSSMPMYMKWPLTMDLQSTLGGAQAMRPQVLPGQNFAGRASGLEAGFSGAMPFLSMALAPQLGGWLSSLFGGGGGGMGGMYGSEMLGGMGGMGGMEGFGGFGGM